jgi:hypothetical protein
MGIFAFSFRIIGDLEEALGAIRECGDEEREGADLRRGRSGT